MARPITGCMLESSGNTRHVWVAWLLNPTLFIPPICHFTRPCNLIALSVYSYFPFPKVSIYQVYQYRFYQRVTALLTSLHCWFWYRAPIGLYSSPHLLLLKP